MIADSQLRALILGNSDGIGLGLTRRLIGEGYQVFSMSRRQCPVAGVSEHVICDAAGDEFEAQLRGFVARIGRIDLCVHAIGMSTDFVPETMVGEAAMQRANFLSLVLMMEAVVPGMVARQGGQIVGLSSLADELLVADCPGYPASKAAMTSYLNGTSKQLRRSGVAVSNVRFGFVDTKMAKAPIRPWLMTVERATDVLIRVVRKRPVQVSCPLAMAAIVRVLRWLQRPFVWFGGGGRARSGEHLP